MSIPQKGDTVLIEHYGHGKVIWTEGRSFKVEPDIKYVDRFGLDGQPVKARVCNISCYLSDLISITSTAPKPETKLKADPEFCPSDTSNLKAGDLVQHRLFGYGKVLSLEKLTKDEKTRVVVDFEVGVKTLLVEYAKLRIIYP